MQYNNEMSLSKIKKAPVIDTAPSYQELLHSHFTLMATSSGLDCRFSKVNKGIYSLKYHFKVCSTLQKRQMINRHRWERGVFIARCEEWWLASIVIEVVIDSLTQTQSTTDQTEPEPLPKKFQPEKLPGSQKVWDFDWFLNALNPIFTI